MARNSSEVVYQRIQETPIVPLFFNADLSIATSVLKACYDGGIRVFEFTNRGKEAPYIFAKAMEYVEKECPDLVLGIGTIYDAKQANEFIQMGADFMLQPFITESVGEVCGKHDIPWMPGAMTLTEIRQAEIWGAKIVKIFPGNVVGPAFVKALKGPMPNTQIMVTGGVEPNKESLSTWFNAGAAAVGMGSQLFPADLIAKKDYQAIEQMIAQLITTYREL
ncbi:bifunctional 4-hydroxy-2-oxoglutarate aldolase/2-dehydro-3-deoxy-phosphogluconate aldolase [Aquirufa nivalisilvae]|jgi:2-dehydro-3-deoxyphosphogluconate aldolase/(4S)-4-hydroxy-2-oxoglutarate aldolase|uniref:bifunctional 4-hydroxy-2-oxoglutarate aldolase/2-dehydro-3-deoxy-phosphogluconate aldolase n=1 Tax=Aquirufa nivalisilvae TaxID=2516557 RepID=UPI0010328803|nr:bifunctional 4-hydroxy-2-oxoglutarate aldolase/2-dehydro-3-deoxy-phosphogluconate aldolase [Aquirufa nivalisilvae]MCZ2479340.1 bifunctional 4-hydroxy-2-oxoglutarate aldolase/2-dehydro-3-deoxy-phosphogluconate aldolase [Aquirufa nivalisilvae]MCZ2481330.1 bifunctional 4-hydroxy-2-oxoglutarate aldolase/2-dehydro-3-deoxy-phosphogluconate aldolase [Aquirufa nivalisilvae]TBH76563.1 bifunctional 4-hydroxy-2-oxoglutarate aldolase/2-dehydro-3-deoxy-phosphogluconate aldolase [Aquirufa nivalisilvae]